MKNISNNIHIYLHQVESQHYGRCYYTHIYILENTLGNIVREGSNLDDVLYNKLYPLLQGN